MKNRMTSFILSVSAAAVLTACTLDKLQEEMSLPVNGITVTASISAEDETKVTYTDGGTTLHPSWTVGDCLIACDSSHTYGYRVKSLDSRKDAVLELVTSGTQAGSKVTDPAAGTKMYFAYIPGKTPSAINAGKVEVDVSSQQPGDAMPAIMTATGTVQDGKLSLHFRNRCSVIGVKDILIESAGTKTFTKLTLSSHEIVSEATLNLKDETLTGKDPSKFITSSISATAGTDGTLSGAYFIAMIPCTTRSIYPIVLTATDTEGNTYSKPLNSKDKTWTAGKYYYLHGKSTPTLTRNTLPAVAMTAGSVQWADRNLGAASPTEPGTYYMWGSVDRIYSSISGNQVNITPPATGFDYKNAPFSKKDSSESYSRYNSADGRIILAPADDIVQLTWPGSGWQMPDKDDFDALKSLTWSWDDNTKCKYSGSLKFRAAGYLDGTDRRECDMTFNVWSSSRCESPECSYTWHGDDFSSPQTISYRRCYGYPVRPVRKQ